MAERCEHRVSAGSHPADRSEAVSRLMSVAHSLDPTGIARSPELAPTRQGFRGRRLPLTPNLFLASLPPASLQSLLPHLRRVTLPRGRHVMEPDQSIRAVYFPETGVLSQAVRLNDGSVVEVNLVGYEGMAGLAVYLGTDTSPLEVVTLISGSFLKMAAGAFAARVAVDRELLDRLHLYTQVVLSVRACSVACYRLHPVQARLARWLLKTHDRVSGDTFQLTQESLALMLGVARPSVTVNALALQRAGLIQYQRGQIRILDRPGLEAATCECYWIVRREFDRLMGGAAG
jgi:CRP-like cAMP-binding protein